MFCVTEHLNMNIIYFITSYRNKTVNGKKSQWHSWEVCLWRLAMVCCLDSSSPEGIRCLIGSSLCRDPALASDATRRDRRRNHGRSASRRPSLSSSLSSRPRCWNQPRLDSNITAMRQRHRQPDEQTDNGRWFVSVKTAPVSLLFMPFLSSDASRHVPFISAV